MNYSFELQYLQPKWAFWCWSTEFASSFLEMPLLHALRHVVFRSWLLNFICYLNRCMESLAALIRLLFQLRVGDCGSRTNLDLCLESSHSVDSEVLVCILSSSGYFHSPLPRSILHSWASWNPCVEFWWATLEPCRFLRCSASQK